MILDTLIAVNLIAWVAVCYSYRRERAKHRRFIRRMYDYHDKNIRRERNAEW